MEKSVEKSIVRIICYVIAIIVAYLTSQVFNFVLICGVVASMAMASYWEYVCLTVFLVIFFKSEIAYIKMFITSRNWGVS